MKSRKGSRGAIHNLGYGCRRFFAGHLRRFKSKTGDWEERTEWHNITLWGRLAEIAGEYLAKGKTVYIEGRLQTRKWQDRDGRDRYTTEIVADKMQMLGGREKVADVRVAQGPPKTRGDRVGRRVMRSLRSIPMMIFPSERPLT